MSKTKTCWIDDLGDKLESEGIAPGCIFEFFGNLDSACYLTGGVVVSRREPGKRPSSIFSHVVRIYVQNKDGTLTTAHLGSKRVQEGFRNIRGELT